MDLYKEYFSLAQSMQIQQEDIPQWVDARVSEERKKQDAERTERTLEREMKKILAEEQSKTALALAEIELEKHRLQAQQPQPVLDIKTDDFAVKMPKLPVFNEKIDDLESFLHRFEIQASGFSWPKEKWGVALINCLSGELLKVFYTLSPKDAASYSAIKDALLKRFKLTEDGYQERFESVRPEKSEDFSSFLNKTIQFFNRWLELANVKENDFDGLKYLILKNRIYGACNQDLVAFLKERKPKHIEELKTYAENYHSAHPTKSLAKQTHSLPSYAAAAQEPSSKPQTPYNGQTRQTNYKGNPREPQKPPFNRHNGNLQHGNHNPLQHNKSRSQQASTNTFTKYNNWQSGQGQKKTTDTCQICSRAGHTANRCFKYVGYPSQQGTANSAFASQTNDLNQIQSTHNHKTQMITLPEPKGSIKLSRGRCNDITCSILRDTGSSTIGVRKSLVNDSDRTGFKKQVITFNGNTESYELGYVNIESPYITGRLLCCMLDNPIADLIIGNIEGINDKPLQLDMWETQRATAQIAETRSQKHKQEAKLHTYIDPQEFDHNDFVKAQMKDKSLKPFFKLVNKNTKSKYNYTIEDGILFRQHFKGQKQWKQIVTPQTYRNKLLSIGHESITSGHVGSSSTLKRISQRFTWPGITKDVKYYVRSCDICQKRVSKGRVPRVPLQQMQRIDKPFEKIAIDIIGPLPKSNENHTHILTLVDYATRWPEAVPLKSTTSEHIAEALVSIFSRLGIPKQILSDNASNLTSNLMDEAISFLGIKQTITTIYNAQANNLSETLKSMLRKVASKNPRSWNRYVPALLFAYREIPQESTGFSPFELMYGRQPRGPIDVIYDICKGNTEQSHEKMFAYAYVDELRDRIDESCRLAQESAFEKAKIYKTYADRKSQIREFQVGDEVLVLLPQDPKKLLMTWKGPYKVVSVRSGVNYEIQIDNKTKTLHANMLKKYIRRNTTEPHIFNREIACLGLISETDDDEGQLTHIPMVQNDQQETYQDVNINPNLSSTQRSQIDTLITQYKDVLTDNPGHTNIIEHEIRLTTTEPVKAKIYPIPFHSRDQVKSELEYMLNMGIVRYSNSPYCSPIVVVKKKEGNIRVCIDFRKLNEITVFDAEPIPNQEELFCELSQAKYYTKLDLTRGYWQIPLKEECKMYTAFQSPIGLLEFNVMPFGLSTAASTFQRMMRTVLQDIPGTISYFDDACIFSETWEEHIGTLQRVLDAIKHYQLTVKPSKTNIGYNQVDFLGHTVNDGTQTPEQTKCHKIDGLVRPQTKKDVRKMVGLINFYRKYVDNFAHIVTPLTNLTKKGLPNKVQWTDECESSFNTIKQKLNSKPILAMPDLQKNFIVRTDASDKGISGILLQERDGQIMPCLHVSRKLLDREKKYSVIERECLAIVFTLTKFQNYLLLAQFILETDHKPLTYLNTNRMKNSRILRWSIILQDFNFSIRHIRGSDNLHADLLSRLV